MSLNQKILTASFLAVAVVAFGAVRYYQKTHPKYVPPPPREEVTLTIIPGWNLRQVAEYLVLKGFATSTEDVYNVTGAPATINDVRGNPIKIVRGRTMFLSMEGYLAPETFRVFKDASIHEIIDKFNSKRGEEFEELYDDLTRGAYGSDEILTMASIIEKEVKHDEDRAKVADILWRRLKIKWALQVDSSVHYAVDRTGDVFTTQKEREVESPWNTYLHAGLPPGPICNPSVESIKAALYPEKNEYWYFLSGKDGKMYYAKTLEEHNANKKHL